MSNDLIDDRRKIFESLFPDLIGWEGKTFRNMESGRYEFDKVNDAWFGFVLAWNYQQKKLDALEEEIEQMHKDAAGSSI